MSCMRRILIVVLFQFLLTSASGQDTVPLKTQADTNTPVLISMDSMLQRINDSMRKENLEQNNRNLDAFVALQKEREAKEKKRMYFRLGIGILFLAVMVIGLLRKRKKAKSRD